IKFVLVCLGILLTFTHPLRPSTAQSTENPLLYLLENVSQEHVFPQMAAMTITYADYRAIERANEIEPVRDRADYLSRTDTERNLWQMSLLRVYAGPHNYPNLTQDKIENMPDLMGFDFFDIDSAMVFGSDPYVGTLVHSADAVFDRRAINVALHTRNYDPLEVATGVAWGKGGDGMTDISHVEPGDPFGGDVGLASRVAVLDDRTVGNAFLWGVLQRAAETRNNEYPPYSDLPEYRAMAASLYGGDGTLLQTTILSRAAGEQQQPAEEVDMLPPYVLGGISDLQDGDMQIHRFTLLYDDTDAADTAAALLPELVTEVSGPWLENLNFNMGEVQVKSVDGFIMISLDIRAPAPTAQDVLDGANNAALLYGFWMTALRQGQFYPLAILPPDSDNADEN
ncbi:MAG: hypothetical protein AAFV33_27705, partial [Chloroflexota bacterium]